MESHYHRAESKAVKPRNIIWTNYFARFEDILCALAFLLRNKSVRLGQKSIFLLQKWKEDKFKVTGQRT